MNDRRVTAIRSALEALVESIDATMRIARWDISDPVPDSLRLAAAQLEANMKLANELARGNVSGTPAIVHRLSVTSSAVIRLTAAYREFESLKNGQADEVATARENLDAAIDSVNEDMRNLD
jgi:hypothetical protein